MAIKPTDALDVSSGWNLVDDEEGNQPVVSDNAVAWGHVGDTYQIAGLGSGLGRGLAGALKRGTRGIIESAKPADVMSAEEKALMDKVLRDIRNKEIPEGRRARKGDLEAVEQGGEPPIPIAPGAPTPRAKMGESGAVNLERHHPGAMQQDYVRLAELSQQDPQKILKNVQSAEDLADALDAIGKGMKLQEPRRTHASIRDDGIDFDAAAKALVQEGLANDSQLYALRGIVATLGDKTTALARKIYQGDHSPETLLQYQQAGQQLIVFTKFTKGQTREVARALSQQNMIADTLQGNDLKALDMAIMQSAGNPQTLIDNASALAISLNKGIDPSRALADSLDRRTGTEAAIEFWKANTLSAPATHAANALSGLVVSTFETLPTKRIV